MARTLIDSAQTSKRPMLSRALFGLRKLVRWKPSVRLRTLVIAAAVLLLGGGASFTAWAYSRYYTSPVMELAVQEFANTEYPEDPAIRSLYFGQYSGRKITLVQKSQALFDFVLEPADPQTAKVVFHDVDVSLMTPSLPEWARADAGLTRIALTDRQWNRQQVHFDRGSGHLEVTGGDGFEMKNLYTAELAKNCLNAGLWEVLLFVEEEGQKALCYHGWFSFPLGHYRQLFERNTGLSYWKHAHYLEHWFDPAGTPVRLEGLRRVLDEQDVSATFDPSEPILAAGEQVGKRRTTLAANLRSWGDFFDNQHRVRFAQFIPPGRYSVSHPWQNQYGRLSRFGHAIMRKVLSPAASEPLDELELVFTDAQGNPCRFLVSGFELAKLAQLPAREYFRGLYMPMGIGTPPFFQTYDDLQKNSPHKSPYFSLMLDGQDRWINHHDLAVDGPVMHRDINDPSLLHVYLLSYERHSLIIHVIVQTQA
jgi:hypothetical protein